MPRVTEERVWAGTEASLHAALDAEEARATRMAAGERLGDKDRDVSRLLSVDDDGVATIKQAIAPGADQVVQDLRIALRRIAQVDAAAVGRNQIPVGR